MKFLRDVCFCLFVVAFAVIVSFLFGFRFWPNSIFSSKDAAVTTAAVELIIRTIIVLLLLTLKITYYSRELSIQ